MRAVSADPGSAQRELSAGRGARGAFARVKGWRSATALSAFSVRGFMALDLVASNKLPPCSETESGVAGADGLRKRRGAPGLYEGVARMTAVSAEPGLAQAALSGVEPPVGSRRKGTPCWFVGRGGVCRVTGLAAEPALSGAVPPVGSRRKGLPCWFVEMGGVRRTDLSAEPAFAHTALSGAMEPAGSRRIGAAPSVLVAEMGRGRLTALSAPRASAQLRLSGALERRGCTL